VKALAEVEIEFLIRRKGVCQGELRIEDAFRCSPGIGRIERADFLADLIEAQTGRQT